MSNTPQPITPDTSDGLDKILITLVAKTAKRTSDELHPMDISFVEIEEARKAIEAYVAQRVIEGRRDELKSIVNLQVKLHAKNNLWAVPIHTINERIQWLTNNIGGEDA